MTCILINRFPEAGKAEAFGLTNASAFPVKQNFVGVGCGLWAVGCGRLNFNQP